MTNLPQPGASLPRTGCGRKNERSDLARHHGGFFLPASERKIVRPRFVHWNAWRIA